MKRPLLIVLPILFALFACGKTGEGSKKTPKKIVSFTVLLDLSDRIQKSGQAQRDINLVKALFEQFKLIARQKTFLKSTDAFKVIIAPQKGMPESVKNLENELRINFDALTWDKRKKAMDKVEANLEKNLASLYQQARAGKQKNEDYFGADIWKYFNEDLPTDLATKDGIENYVFVITDGYLYFENYDNTMRQKNRYSSCEFMKALRGNNWRETFCNCDYGIISTRQKYPNLQVMVLETAPKDDFVDEYSLLQEIWQKWLSEMDIKNMDIYKDTDALDKIKEKTKAFVQQSKTITPPCKSKGDCNPVAVKETPPTETKKTTSEKVAPTPITQTTPCNSPQDCLQKFRQGNYQAGEELKKNYAQVIRLGKNNTKFTHTVSDFLARAKAEFPTYTIEKIEGTSIYVK